MNKVLVIAVSDNKRGHLTAGGLSLDTEEGLREAMAMAEFARGQLTEALIELKVRDGREQTNATPPELS